MKYRYLPATIMLLAGAITSIMSIVNGYETLYSLKLLLGILLLFWFIGGLARFFLLRITAEKVEDKKEETGRDREEAIHQDEEIID